MRALLGRLQAAGWRHLEVERKECESRLAKPIRAVSLSTLTGWECSKVKDM